MIFDLKIFFAKPILQNVNILKLGNSGSIGYKKGKKMNEK